MTKAKSGMQLVFNALIVRRLIHVALLVTTQAALAESPGDSLRARFVAAPSIHNFSLYVGKGTSPIGQFTRLKFLADGSFEASGAKNVEPCKGPALFTERNATGSCDTFLKSRERVHFEFKVSIKPSSESRLVFDIDKMCANASCLSLKDQCLLLNLRGNPSTYSCTRNEIQPSPHKPAPDDLTALIALARSENATIATRTNGGGGTGFALFDTERMWPDASSWVACQGIWSQKGANQIRIACDARDQFTSSVVIDVTSISTRSFEFTRTDNRKDSTTQKQGPLVAYISAANESCRGDSVQLVSGGNSAEFHQRVREALADIQDVTWREFESPGAARADAPKLCLPQFYEGAAAKNKRKVSEIFFRDEMPHAATSARTLARILEPIIGRVETKPWPGDTRFDVVLVTGDATAEEGEGL